MSEASGSGRQVAETTAEGSVASSQQSATGENNDLEELRKELNEIRDACYALVEDLSSSSLVALTDQAQTKFYPQKPSKKRKLGTVGSESSGSKVPKKS